MRKPAVVCGILVLSAGLAPAAAEPPVALPQLVPSWAIPAARLGPVRAASTVPIELILPWRDPAGAARLARAVSDPASPAYTRYLTSAEFRARFAPAAATLGAATSWLRAQGLEVGTIPANRVVIPARGDARTVARAFRVGLAEYRVGSLRLRAPDRAPVLPAALARLGILVRGLDESSSLLTAGGPLSPSLFADPRSVAAEPPPDVPETPASPADAAPPSAVVYAPPCSPYDGATADTRAPRVAGRTARAVACATSVASLRAAYGVDAMLKRHIDGRGQTIVMTGSHEIRPLPDDLATWSRRNGIPALRAGQFRQLSYPGAYQTPADPSGLVLRPHVWAQQSAMLFETMRAVAPGANYLYIGSTSSLDLQNVMLLAVDRHYGDVIVNGWYAADEALVTPADTAPIDRAAEQAAATGISLLWASGDLGDNAKFNASESGETPVPGIGEVEAEGVGSYTVPDVVTAPNIVVVPGHPSVSFPAHNAMITAVGATSLITGRGGTYVRELGWAKSTRTAAGGKWSGRDRLLYRASGGGTSNIYNLPMYQRGVVPENLFERQNGSAGRAVPDVAVNGDAETGLMIGYTQRFSDGTNRYSERRVNADTAATALFGAMIALANQQARHALGFVNPLLYFLARSKPGAFRDIVASGKFKAAVRRQYVDAANPSGGTTAVLKTFEEFGTNRPARGYDTCTGIGAPSRSFFGVFR